MSESKKAAPAKGRDLVFWNKEEERACLELHGDEVAYPIDGVTGNVSWTGFFVLSPINEREYKNTRTALSDSVSVEQVGRSEVHLKVGAGSVREIVPKLFKRIEGLKSKASVEEQLEWLKRNENIMFKVWNTGVEGIALDIEDEVEGELDILAHTDKDSSTEYSLTQDLYSLELEEVVPLQVSFTLSRENHAQRQQHDSALESILNTRKDTRKVRENLDVILGLFDQLVTGADGVLVDGIPFNDSIKDAATRKKVLKIVPPQVKYLVVKEHFDTDRAKN